MMTITKWTPEEIAEARARSEMAAMVDVKTFLSALDEIERLRETLTWYAEADNYNINGAPDCNGTTDWGHMAREVMK